MLQSDEAKTVLGDVLSAGSYSNISDGESINQTIQLSEDDENLNISRISESNVIVSGNMSSGSHNPDSKFNVSQGHVSPHRTEELLTSSGESDIDKKVNNHNYYRLRPRNHNVINRIIVKRLNYL